MSDERLEELAALHVLGALTPAEQSEFDAALGRDPELRVLVAACWRRAMPSPGPCRQSRLPPRSNNGFWPNSMPAGPRSCRCRCGQPQGIFRASGFRGP